MLPAAFPAETLQARRKLHHIVHVMKGKNLQPSLLRPARLLFRADGEISSFTAEQKLECQHHHASFTTNVQGLL